MPSPTATPPTVWSQDAAHRYCERMARTHYENFTVGSWLLPREQRRHVYAIYGYCRSVDDLGDEATPALTPGCSPKSPLTPLYKGGDEVAPIYKEEDEKSPFRKERFRGISPGRGDGDQA